MHRVVPVLLTLPRGRTGLRPGADQRSCHRCAVPGAHQACVSPHAMVTQVTVERSGTFHEERGPGGKPRDHGDLPAFCRVLGTRRRCPVRRSASRSGCRSAAGADGCRRSATAPTMTGSTMRRWRSVSARATSWWRPTPATRVAISASASAVPSPSSTGAAAAPCMRARRRPSRSRRRRSAPPRATPISPAARPAATRRWPRRSAILPTTTASSRAIPGNNRVNLNLTFLWHFQKNHAHGDNATPILTPEKLRLVHKAAVDACDALDGVKDGVINDPRQCTFDVASLACKRGEDPAQCLAPTQVEAMKAMMPARRMSVPASRSMRPSCRAARARSPSQPIAFRAGAPIGPIHASPTSRSASI